MRRIDNHFAPGYVFQEVKFPGNPQAKSFYQKWTAIFGILFAAALVVLPGFFAALELRREQRAEQIGRFLKEGMFVSVDYTRKPLRECLEELFGELRKKDPSQPWSYEIVTGPKEQVVLRERVVPPISTGPDEWYFLGGDELISLQLNSVGIAEVLRYVCALAGAELRWEQAHCRILPTPNREATWQPVEELVLGPVPWLVGGKPVGPGPIDLRGKLEASFGVEFYEGDRVEYFPGKGITEVAAGRKTLELVELYLGSTTPALEEPGIWQRAKNKTAEVWLQVMELVDPTVPPKMPTSPSPSPAVGVPVLHDPFGRSGSPPTSGAPDPFGMQ